MDKLYVEAENELPLFERPAGATGVNAPRPPTGPEWHDYSRFCNCFYCGGQMPIQTRKNSCSQVRTLWLNGVAWLRNATEREWGRAFRGVIILRGVLSERTLGNGRNGRVHAHTCQKEKKKLCSHLLVTKRGCSPVLLKASPRHASFVSVNQALYSIHSNCRSLPGLIRTEGESPLVMDWKSWEILNVVRFRTFPARKGEKNKKQREFCMDCADGIYTYMLLVGKWKMEV